MDNDKNRICFNESIKLNSKEKQEELCLLRKKRGDNVSSNISRYCKYGVNMWLTIGKDFYI